MVRILFGLALLALGLGMVYLGFNDEFSIGEKVHYSLRRGGSILSEGIREYGYFDAFKNRIIPIFFGGLFSFFGYSVLSDND